MLEVLALEGNGVAALPGYRSRCLATCAVSLRRLDGRDVTVRERRDAAPANRRDRAVWDDLRRLDARAARCLLYTSPSPRDRG